MENIPFHAGISVPVDLIVIIMIFLKNSTFHRLGCRLMKIFVPWTWLLSLGIL
jgi:hypothetical protein